MHNDYLLLEGGPMKEDKAEAISLDQNLELMRKELALNVVNLGTLKQIVQIRGYYIRSIPITKTTPEVNKIYRRQVMSQMARMIASRFQSNTMISPGDGCLIQELHTTCAQIGSGLLPTKAQMVV